MRVGAGKRTRAGRTQLKLRTFLCLAALAGVGSGFFADRAMYFAHVLECVPEIEKHSMQVHSNFYDRYGLFPPARQGKWPILFEWSLSNPEEIVFLAGSGANNDTLMKKVATLYTVRRVNLGSTNISPIGLRELSQLPHLEAITLGDSAVDDDALAILARFPALQKLDLRNAPITDAGLWHLARMSTLQEVHLYKTNVTRRGLVDLRSARPDLAVDATF